MSFGRETWIADVERVAEALNMKLMSEDEATKALTALGFDPAEIAEKLKETEL